MLFSKHFWPNYIGTIGIFCIQVSDWIFTEQYLTAALNLPVVIFMFQDDRCNKENEVELNEGYGQRTNIEKSTHEFQARACRKALIIKVIYYVLLVAWVAISFGFGSMSAQLYVGFLVLF